jgi:hypothetical protein
VPVTNVNIGGPAIGQNGTLVVCGVGTDVRAYRGAPLNVEDGSDDGVAELPTLFQNYPNPFNPQTVIRFEVPNSRSVSLTVYGLLGSVVATLVNEELTSGSYERTFDGAGLASGVYVYHLSSGGFRQTRRFLLLK